MGNKLIIDNWLLQDIGSCFSSGLSDDIASELVINRAANVHSFLDIPMAGVQIEALLEFLVDIVLRDSIILDSAFTDAWSEYDSVFSILLSQGLIRTLNLFAHEDKLGEPRKYSVGQLCVTSSLREAQQKNEESWASIGEADDQYISQIIWGTAGMLSRSHVFEAPYSGHPMRKRVIEQTIFANPLRDSVSTTQEWINDQRLRLFDIEKKHGLQRTASIVLPPISVEIIEESSCIEDLILVAYQLRDKYTPMREWMRTVQKAMESEDAKSIAKYKKTLNSVSKDLDRSIGKTNTGSVSLKIGLGWPSLSIPLPLDGVVKKFGIRAMLNNQIFSSQGEQSVKKLLRMFDVGGTSLGLSAQEYLRGRVQKGRG